MKPIAFYLPQFHPIPENDKAYGEGFTEWTNTKKAKPLFPGHYQPKTPLNGNYYSLLDEEVMINQAKLAKAYGVYGFCYYHYWFKNCHKLLEKPLENMLANPSIDMPFCLCWANENWTRRWDGGNNEVIVSQDYGNLKELIIHVDYLCRFFDDERYIKIDGKPLLIIYKPELIPNLRETLECIRNRSKENNHEVLLMCQYPTYYFEKKQISNFDYYIQFQPMFMISLSFIENGKSLGRLKKRFSHIISRMGLGFIKDLYNKYKIRKLQHLDYDSYWLKILDFNVDDSKLIAGAFVDWDNTARNKTGIVFEGASPKKFHNYMSQLIKKVKTEYSQPYIFINAWNEWAEGCFLEPDERYGYAYLEALKNALVENDEFY